MASLLIRRVLALGAGLFLTLLPALSQQAPVLLDGNGLSVEIDSASGGLVKVTNKLSGENYTASGPAFEFETLTDTIAASAVQSVDRNADGVVFHYSSPGWKSAVHYHLGASGNHLEKTIEITNTSSAPVVLKRMAPWQIQSKPAFADLHPHYDPSQFRWLINVFLRGAKGGLFCGVENPISEFSSKGATTDSSWIQVHYAPNISIAPGDTYTTDIAFLGAFRKEHIYVFKELNKLRHAVNQPKAVPSFLDLSQEVLDWGEVWAMQDYVRARQPAHDFEQPGFYVRVVAMVGGPKTGEMGEGSGFHIAFEPSHVSGSKAFTDDIVKLGHVPHIEWATEWFGSGGYGNPTRDFVLENSTGVDTPANPNWLDVIQYGWSKGIQTGIFETVTRNFARPRKEWKVVLPNGGLWTWGKDLPMNCWANPEYLKWRIDVTDRAVRDYKLYMIAYDAIVPADWSWFGWPIPRTECYATNHGHLPGDIRYLIFRNTMAFFDEMQRRHPKLAIRAASGLTTSYPWVLKNLIEYHPNFYDGETGATYWTSYNFRFLPMYKSGVLLSAKNKADFEWLLLRSISVSDHFMLWPDALPIALENKPFWDRWLSWADKNIEYLRVGRTLFREPWGDSVVASLPPALEGALPHPQAQIHGSAHVIGEHGFLFLFNPDSKTRVASLPVNHWIGLTVGDQVEIRQIYPETVKSFGSYQRGEQFSMDVPARAAVVLELRAMAGAAGRNRPQITTPAPVDKAFLSWDELPFADMQAAP